MGAVPLVPGCRCARARKRLPSITDRHCRDARSTSRSQPRRSGRHSATAGCHRTGSPRIGTAPTPSARRRPRRWRPTPQPRDWARPPLLCRTRTPPQLHIGNRKPTLPTQSRSTQPAAGVRTRGRRVWVVPEVPEPSPTSRGFRGETVGVGTDMGSVRKSGSTESSVPQSILIGSLEIPCRARGHRHDNPHRDTEHPSRWQQVQ